jgi:N-methylhydantoinase A
MSGGITIAVDVGGTFTDVSLMAPGQVAMIKVATSEDTVEGVLQGVGEVIDVADVDPGEVSHILHATTVATNAIFARAGARTAVVATAGFGDIVHIGREVRSGPERFQVMLPKPYPFVDESDVFEISERVLADGSIYEPVQVTDIKALVHSLLTGGYETVAVSLLHSYSNPTHELAVRDVFRAIAPSIDVMLSHEVCPEPGEYERTMTTIVSAYISPLLGRYVSELTSGFEQIGVNADLIIVGSDGSGINADELRHRPIVCLESGPVAGVLAGKNVALGCGIPACLTLDIGGTTSKAGVIVDGRIELTKDFRVGGGISTASRRSASAIPVRMPVVDLAELGIGGGSIAWVDEAGSLRVGPKSVGAHPGPASFGKGGILPTVTDAAVVLGLLHGQNVLGSDRPLDVNLANEALALIGSELGIDAMLAASAVRGVASAEIAAAVHKFLFYRGINPALLTLIAFGGTGPLHATEVADIVGVRSVLVPQAAGVFTAVGLLSAEICREHSRHVRIELSDRDDGNLEQAFGELEADAMDLLHREGLGAQSVRVERTVDVRFRQQVQAMPLNLPSGPIADNAAFQLFCSEFERQFALPGSDLAEVIDTRIRVIARQLNTASTVPPSTEGGLRDTGGRVKLPSANGFEVAAQFELSVDGEPQNRVDSVVGPALIVLPHATAVVDRLWEAHITREGDVTLQRTEGEGVAN